MATSTHTQKALRQNPFAVYRDPKTGQWVVIHHSQSTSQNNCQSSDSASDSASG